MSVLFGHSVGNPNSYQVALSYFEAGMLEAFCIPWMPTKKTIKLLASVKPLRALAARLSRRQVSFLSEVPKIQGRGGEIARLARRSIGLSGDEYSELNNFWLMNTMARECHRNSVTVLHAYEDCSLAAFEEARLLNKACVYDLPTCYFPVWERAEVELRAKFSEWLPSVSHTQLHLDRKERKKKELDLADLVLVASQYVEEGVKAFAPNKNVTVAPYGVDTEFWSPGWEPRSDAPLKFVYAGQISVRKGVPLLLEAWTRAGLYDAELTLVGSWALNDRKRQLPPNVTWIGPCSSQRLREVYRQSDCFVFPTYSDGFGLVLLEAMACGLPVISSKACAAPDVVTLDSGRIFSTGNLDELVELLNWASENRDRLSGMRLEATTVASRHTWQRYREIVRTSVIKFS